MMQWIAGLSVILVHLALVYPGFALDENDPCTTPAGKSGTCIEIRECDALNVIMNKKIISPQESNLVSESVCGMTADKKYLVCCMSTVGEDLLVPPKCGNDFSNRIFGGQPTEIDEFPWTALIHYHKPNGQTGFHCGGTLINLRYVLTAAHCVNGIPRGWSVVGVRLGEWDLSKERDCESDNVTCTDPPVDMDIEQMVVHEGFDPKNAAVYNDIALIRFTQNVNQSIYIAPICLPHKDPQLSRDLVGSKGYAVGWGKTESGTVSNFKLKVQLEVKDFPNCVSIYQRAGVTLRDTQMCAGAVRGEDTCTGDSGGAFMKLDRSNYYLIGIVSFGSNKCGTASFPSIYTNVAKYVDWIKTNLKP